jgi:hypothetical protein
MYFWRSQTRGLDRSSLSPEGAAAPDPNGISSGIGRRLESLRVDNDAVGVLRIDADFTGVDADLTGVGDALSSADKMSSKVG